MYFEFICQTDETYFVMLVLENIFNDRKKTTALLNCYLCKKGNTIPLFVSRLESFFVSILLLFQVAIKKTVVVTGCKNIYLFIYLYL